MQSTSYIISSQQRRKERSVGLNTVQFEPAVLTCTVQSFAGSGLSEFYIAAINITHLLYRNELHHLFFYPPENNVNVRVLLWTTQSLQGNSSGLPPFILVAKNQTEEAFPPSPIATKIQGFRVILRHNWARLAKGQRCTMHMAIKWNIQPWHLDSWCQQHMVEQWAVLKAHPVSLSKDL